MSKMFLLESSMFLSTSLLLEVDWEDITHRAEFQAATFLREILI